MFKPKTLGLWANTDKFNFWEILPKIMDWSNKKDIQIHVTEKIQLHNKFTFGNIPKIDGGEFIVGEFENTLPSFFEKSRPKGSIINFDADLYSSTICALNNAKSVIDKHTILIFDEFIINKNWEKDEYKAL